MNSLVIVALPNKDDYVNKISSEKAAHMTLLFLGEDSSKVANLNNILNFVQHAASRSLERFGLEVDRRGEFGPDLADVLFFSKSKWSGFDKVNNFRAYLLQDNNIRKAYEAATQFPEFTPHLTLGYPATPANSDEREYPGISYVQFDRIAVWFGDSEGIEFPLKGYEWDTPMDMAMSDIDQKAVEDLLEHHGVLGMKWGRRSGSNRSSGPSKKMKVAEALARGVDNAAFELAAKKSETEMRINQRASERLVRSLPAIKARHGDYGKLSNRVKKPFSKEARAYREDVKKTWLKHLEKSANEITNELGTRQYTLSESGKPNTSSYFWKVHTQAVKHAQENTFTFRPIFDDEGWIIGIEQVDDSLMQTSLIVDDILQHYGKKGMHWGIRNVSETLSGLRSRKVSSGPQAVSIKENKFGGKKLRTSGGKGYPAHADAIRARTIGQKGKASGLKALSDKELQDYSRRLQLEANVKRLNYNEKNAGAKFVATVLGQTGKNQANEVAGSIASTQVKKHLTGRLVKIGAVAAA